MYDLFLHAARPESGLVFQATHVVEGCSTRTPVESSTRPIATAPRYTVRGAITSDEHFARGARRCLRQCQERRQRGETDWSRQRRDHDANGGRQEVTNGRSRGCAKASVRFEQFGSSSSVGALHWFPSEGRPGSFVTDDVPVEGAATAGGDTLGQRKSRHSIDTGAGRRWREWCRTTCARREPNEAVTWFGRHDRGESDLLGRRRYPRGVAAINFHGVGIAPPAPTGARCSLTGQP